MTDVLEIRRRQDGVAVLVFDDPQRPLNLLCPDLRFIQKFSKSAVKIINQIRAEQVQGSLRVIKDQHSHTVLPPADLQHISHTASMSTAVPRAPAAQEATRPMLAFSCSIRAAQFI